MFHTERIKRSGARSNLTLQVYEFKIRGAIGIMALPLFIVVLVSGEKLLSTFFESANRRAVYWPFPKTPGRRMPFSGCAE
jgi:hypothetical protein